MGKKNKKQKVKFIDKVHMWDNILSNLYLGSGILDPRDSLSSSDIAVDFAGIHSAGYMTKYFLITQYPDWIYPRMLDVIRMNCLDSGVKVNFYIYEEPYKIDWDSADMKNRLGALRRFSERTEDLEDVSVFEYRGKKQQLLAKKRVLESMTYLNRADIDYRRSLWLNYVIVEISGKRGYDDKYLHNMSEAIKNFRVYCANAEIQYKELRINVNDWLRALSPFSLRYVKEVRTKIVKKVLTDDIMANLYNSYKQGKIGTSGALIGLDVSNKLPVMVNFRLNTTNAENWLICATTGGGKSFFVKHFLMWLLGTNIPVTVTDFEGDEYAPFADFVRADCPEDVVVISMGKGSNTYCDPMIIPDLTGVPEIDESLKQDAMTFTRKVFKILATAGENTDIDKWQVSVLNDCIKRVYHDYGITDDQSTWSRSKDCNIKDVYDTLENSVRRKIYLDEANDNLKHKAAVNILEACRSYFEEGEADYGTFEKRIDTDALFRAKLVIFSFGERGKTASEMDKVAVQLKQLSVANLTNQMSNYHKYVRKTLNVKVWEEYQRWGEIPGSNEILKNVITGGRKRGDINFVITNDLSAILSADPISETIRNNFTSYAIGKLTDSKLIDRFVTTCALEDLRAPLERISQATSTSDSRYNKAFCVCLNNTDKAVVKVSLPEELARSKMYATERGTS